MEKEYKLWGRKLEYYYHNLNIDYGRKTLFPIEGNAEKWEIRGNQRFQINVHPCFTENDLLNNRLILYLTQGYLNYLDFFIFNDNNDEYYLIELNFYMNEEIYPIGKNYCTIFGVNINFLIEKKEFSNLTEEEIEFLLNQFCERRDLSTFKALESECKVLINFKEERTMKLREIFEFLWDQENIEKYESALIIRHGNPWSIYMNYISVSNEDNLKSFLFNLYHFYRRIEKHLEMINYPVIAEFNFDNLNCYAMKIYLEKLLPSFKKIDNNNFIDMCKKAKELFKCYQAYLDCNFKNKTHIEYENYIPWINYLKMLMPKIDGYFTFIKQAKQLKHLRINAKTSSYLVRKCPSITCSRSKYKQWKCSICDEFIKIKTVQCHCGDKLLEELDFYCENKSKQLIIEKLNQFNDENENKNKQATTLCSLVNKVSAENFENVVETLYNFNINEEINKSVGDYFCTLKLNKFTVIEQSKSDDIITDAGYIKFFSVSQEMLNNYVGDVKHLITKCPLSDECNDQRFKLHLCLKCEKFTKIKTLECKCGDKNFNESHFICGTVEHKKNFYGNGKNVIIEQLKKYKNEDDSRIQSVLKLLNISENDCFMEVITLIQTLNINDDTKKFIDDYIANI